MRRLAAIPFAVLLLPLLCGIAAGTWCPLHTWVRMALCCLLVLGLVSAFAVKKLRQTFLFAAAGVCLFLLSWYRTEQKWNATEVTYSGENHTYCLHLQDVPQMRERTVRCEAEVLYYLQDTVCMPAHGRIMLYLWRDSLSEQLRQGDCLIVNTTVNCRNNGNPAEFDYAAYLRLQGIAGSAFANADNWEKTGNKPIHTLLARARCRRQALLDTYRRLGIDGAELGVLSALTLGDKSLLDTETKQAYSVAGAMHVLAVSGLHVGIIYGVVYLLLTGFGWYPPLYRQRIRRMVQTVVIILALWFYAFLTGLAPSVMRSALMLSLLSFGMAIRRRSNTYNTIAASAFICLVIDPLTLFTVSFQLSYAAVLAIVYYAPRFARLLPNLPWGVRHVWNLLTVSLAAQIGTIPFTLYYFGQTSNYFALTNLFVIPMATIAVCTALIALLLSWTPVAALVAVLLRWELQLMNAVTGWIEHLPFASTAISLNAPMCCTLIAFIVCLTVFCRLHKWYWLSASAIMLTAFLGIYRYRILTTAHTERLVVYNISKCNTLLYQQGNTAVVYTDDSLAAARYVNDYAKSALLQQWEYHDLSCQSSFSFTWRDSTYWLVRDSVLVNKTTDTSIVVHGLLLGDIGRISPQRLFGIVQADKVFLMPSMRPYKVQQMEQYMNQHAIPYRSLRNGALIVE